jgi:hypothetical protein
MSGISIGPQQVSVYNALVPPEGPKSIAQVLDFSASSSILIDFTTAYERKAFTVLQTVFVDNFLNPDTITFNVPGTGQQFDVPPGSQGFFPVVAASRAKLRAVSTGGIPVPCVFMNVPMPVGVWYASGNAGGGPVTIADQPIGVNIENEPIAVTVAPAAQTTPIAGAVRAIVTGGTAVNAFSAGAIVTEGLISNPIAATESLFVDLVNAAGTTAPGTNGTTFEVPAGASFRCPPSTLAVSVNAATSGHAFTAVSF